MIIAICLAWYYSDEIRAGTVSIMDWLNSQWRGNNPDPRNDPENNIDRRTLFRERLEKSVNEKLKNTTPVDLPKELENPMDKYFTQDKGKGRNLTSPSLEDLNSKVKESWLENLSSSESISSSSSDETIKGSSSPVGIEYPLNDNFMKETVKGISLSELPDKWRSIIKSDLKESIDYIEKHLPTNELDDSSYILQLLDEVRNRNLKFLSDINKSKHRLSTSKLIFLTKLNDNVDKWIEEMRSKISKFE